MDRPHITLKLATSLDGRIATASGESQWITDEESRAIVHRMRAGADVVMIGAETARADNPSLLARLDPMPSRQPARAVVTSRLNLLPQGKLFEQLDVSPLIVFGAERTGPAHHAVLEGAGAIVELVPATDGGLDLNAVLEKLGARGAQHVFVEGGGRLAAALIAADLVDQIEWFRAPILFGAEGRPAVGALAMQRLADAPRYKRVETVELGPDLWESYERA